MTIKSFFAAYKYQMSRNKIALLSMGTGIAVVIAMGVITEFAISGQFTASAIFLQLTDGICMIIAFTFGLILASDYYNCCAANGVSRTTAVAAQILSNLSISALLAAAVSVITPILSLISGNGELWMSEMLYGARSFMHMYGESPLVFRLRIFLLTTFLSALSGSIGFLIGTGLYRVPRKAAIIIIVVFANLMAIAPVIIAVILERAGIDPKAVLNALAINLGNFFGTAHVNGSGAGNVPKGIAAMVFCMAIMSLISWVIARRSSVRPAPIRNG